MPKGPRAIKKRTNVLRNFPARAPLESVVLDLLGPLPKPSSDNTHILVIVVMVDRFSKLCSFLAMRSATAEMIVCSFRSEWVFLYGPPKYLLTDNGTQLTAKLFQKMCRIRKIANHYTSTYHSRTSSETDRLNRTPGSMLRHYVVENQENCEEFLPALEHSYNLF